MRVKIQGRKYRLKNSVIIRMQGVFALCIAILCHSTGADSAALFMGCVACMMILTKIKKEDM